MAAYITMASVAALSVGLVAAAPAMADRFCPFRLLGAVKWCRMSKQEQPLTREFPGALEQGNFGSHQGIELGNQSSVWQGALIGVSWQLCKKR